MQEKINIGIIGAGRMGNVHAKNFAFHVPQAKVIAIADPNIKAAEQCAQNFNIAKATTNNDEIIEDANIHAVIICSPTITHAKIALEAANAGKHILCEKPLGTDIELIDKAIDTAKNNNLLFQVGFNRRFDPSFQHAKELISAGKIGEPHILRITSRDPEPPSYKFLETSGGIFLETTIHDFDMSRYILDDEAIEIYAIGNSFIDPKIEELVGIDTSITTLQYGGGTLCTIDNSWKTSYGYDQRLEIFGSEGCIVVSNKHLNDTMLWGDHGITSSKHLYFFVERYAESFLLEARHFIDCIINDKPPMVNAIDGKISAIMGLAAWQSLQDQRPMLLDWN